MVNTNSNDQTADTGVAADQDAAGASGNASATNGSAAQTGAVFKDVGHNQLQSTVQAGANQVIVVLPSPE